MTAATHRRRAPEANICPQLKTVLSAWVIDADGTMTRTLTTEELPPAAAALNDEHEHHQAAGGQGAGPQILYRQALLPRSHGRPAVRGGPELRPMPPGQAGDGARASETPRLSESASAADGDRDRGLGQARRHDLKEGCKMKTNMRVIVERLQLEHPGAGENGLVDLLVERLQHDRVLLEAAARYVIETAAPARPGFDARLQLRTPSPEHKAREKAEVRTAAAAVAAQVVLLALVMPNGRPMRSCTGEEMSKFGKAYERIAERAGDNLVGDVLTEAEVRALLADQRPASPRRRAAQSPAVEAPCHL